MRHLGRGRRGNIAAICNEWSELRSGIGAIYELSREVIVLSLDVRAATRTGRNYQ